MADLGEVDPALPVRVHIDVEAVCQERCGAQQYHTDGESNDVSQTHFAIAPTIQEQYTKSA
jgi:hypothetical protein